MTNNSDQADERLRDHPSERMKEAVRVVDFDARFRELLDEDHDSTRGHRQVTITHGDGLTQVLFHFEEGSELRDHQVNGGVSIHVLEGALDIDATGEAYSLEGGQMMTLSRGVTHAVHARRESKMLLTVHLSNS